MPDDGTDKLTCQYRQYPCGLYVDISTLQIYILAVATIKALPEIGCRRIKAQIIPISLWPIISYIKGISVAA
jgi:hypothetical protein